MAERNRESLESSERVEARLQHERVQHLFRYAEEYVPPRSCLHPDQRLRTAGADPLFDRQRRAEEEAVRLARYKAVYVDITRKGSL